MTGLDNGTAYSFRLRAHNASGNGVESSEATATPAAAPARPTGLTATAGTGQVVLSWNDPNDAAITGWEYNQRRAGGAFEADWTYILGSTDSTTSYTVIGLEIGASYGFRVRAIAGDLVGPASDEATVTLPQVPARPAGLTATAGDGQVSLQWSDPNDATITGWQYRVAGTGSYGPWMDIPGSGATTTAHTVAGLDNGTAYSFKLRAQNASGNGMESGEATATPAAVPAKPAGLTATGGAGEAVLSWNDPNDAAITGWEYNQRRAGGEFEADWTYILGSTGSTTRYTVIGLEIGASYGFRVRAIAGDLAGPASDEATVTLPQVPARPAGFTATAGDGRVSLQWAGADDATITGWQYRYRTEGSYGPWMDIPGGNATTTAYIVAGLDNGTAYSFKLRARNASGNGVESDEATATPAAAPAKPTGLTATGGAGEVVLSWNDPNDAAITGWEYKQRRAGGAFEADWTYILGSTDSTTSYTVTGLEIGASYGFRVRAIAGDLAGPASDEATVTLPQVPARPAGFTATAGDGRVSLQWASADDATITGWQYRYRTEGSYGPWMDIPGSGATTTAHIVAGLDNGTAYSFRLRARNASGNGVESGEATATPAAVPAKPTGLTATGGAGEALLSWNDPNDAAITGWEYKQRRAGGEFEADWTYILGSTDRTTRYTVIGLEIGASYGFRVRAVAGDRAGPASDEATVTLPLVPARPTGFAAAAGDRQAVLTWKPLGDPTVMRWQYRYRAEGGGYGRWKNVPNSNRETARHAVAGLAPGIPHHFRIRAVNGKGAGLESG